MSERFFECEIHGSVALPNFMQGPGNPHARCNVCLFMSAMPKRYQAAKLADFEPEVRAAVEKYLLTFGNLLLLGPVGTGKTHMAAAIVAERARQAKVSKYVLARDMSQQIIHDRSVEDFVQPDFLIIDEVGRRFDTDAEGERFFDVVNKRYNEIRPTVFIGNTTPSQFAGAVGGALADRIRHDHTLIVLKGRSRRAGLREVG